MDNLRGPDYDNAPQRLKDRYDIYVANWGKNPKTFLEWLNS